MEETMDNVARKIEYYTYTDYLTWDDDEVRVELIDGIVYDMAAPSVNHQIVLREISIDFGLYFRGHPCDLLIAPTDVRLDADGRDDTVVQPDLFVVCDKSKLDAKSYKGAPVFISEILSPSNSKMDTLIKLNKYLAVGVQEYWIIDPIEKMVMVHILQGDSYSTKVYTEGVIKLSVFENFEIDIDVLFAQLITEPAEQNEG